MKKIKVTDLRKYLKGLSNKEMENEFVNLVKNYPSVNEYFAVKVDTGNLQILTEEFKKKIEHEFFPERGFGNFDFKVIRKVISDMKKITNNNKAVIDLYLHAVLMGVLFTDEYGDINAKFYNNTLNLFYDALEIIRKKNLELEYLEKCKTIYHECPDIGWGFSDGIEELYYNYLGDFFLDDEE